MVGPAALGHDPVVLGDQRKRLRDRINEMGVVNLREDPLIPPLNELSQ